MARRHIVLVAVLVALVAGCTSPDDAASPSKPPPTSSGMWIGTFAKGEALDWKVENNRIGAGKMRVRRSFQPGLSAPWSASAPAPDAEAGIISFNSIRPPTAPDGRQDMRGVIDGKYDSEITNWAKQAPRTGVVFATMSHEPEAPRKGLTGAAFVAGFRHFYRLAKAANPNLRIGPVHMSFQWAPDSTTTTRPNEWWVGPDYADFIGVDDYNLNTTKDRTTPANDPNFQRWYQWASKKGKPLAVAEYGRMENPNDPEALARELRSTEAWLRDHGFMMWLYWNGVGTNADWTMKGPETIKAWSEIAARGNMSS